MLHEQMIHFLEVTVILLVLTNGLSVAAAIYAISNARAPVDRLSKLSEQRSLLRVSHLGDRSTAIGADRPKIVAVDFQRARAKKSKPI